MPMARYPSQHQVHPSTSAAHHYVFAYPVILLLANPNMHHLKNLIHSVIPFLTPGNTPADSGHVFGGIGKRQGVNPQRKKQGAPEVLTPNLHRLRGHLLRVPQDRNLINPLTSTGQDGPAYHMPNYTGTWLFN